MLRVATVQYGVTKTNNTYSMILTHENQWWLDWSEGKKLINEQKM